MKYVQLAFLLTLGILCLNAADDLEIRWVSVYQDESRNLATVDPGSKIKIMCLIKGGEAPFTIYREDKRLGQTTKRTIRVAVRAKSENGSYPVNISVTDAGQRKSITTAYYHVGEQPKPEEPAEPEDTGTLLLSGSPDDDDDWGDDDEDEEDVVDEYLEKGTTVYPWTDYQNRTIMNTMLPSAVAIGDGNWYYRILHVARERIDDEPLTNFIGLDDSVKIGFQVAYGFTENSDLLFQRTNGRALQVNFNRADPTKMDYYDFIFRYQFLKQRNGSFADAAIHVGPTIMDRNFSSAEQSMNAGIIFERNVMKDRLRLGLGVAYASLSTYENTIGKGPATKLTPDEYDALTAIGAPVPDEEDEHTLAIPLMFKYALSKKQQIFGEIIVPIDGYETTAGPSMLMGYRINGNTHEYSVYLSNTGNPSYNGTITGGHDYDQINLFGFTISAFF